MAVRDKKIQKLLDMKKEAEVKVERKLRKLEDNKFQLEDGVVTKAEFTKKKMELSDEIKGLRGRINRLDKQRLSLEKKEKEKMEEEDKEWEQKEMANLEKARKEWKEERAELIDKKKKKLKKKMRKATAVSEAGALAAEDEHEEDVSEEELEVRSFMKAFVGSYIDEIKGQFKKRSERERFPIYKNYPFMVTVVKKEPASVAATAPATPAAEPAAETPTPAPIQSLPETLLVFSHPQHDKLVVNTIKEEKFAIEHYKNIFHTTFIATKDWSEERGKELGVEVAKKDISS